MSAYEQDIESRGSVASNSVHFKRHIHACSDQVFNMPGLSELRHMVTTPHFVQLRDVWQQETRVMAWRQEVSHLKCCLALATSCALQSGALD